MFTILKQGRKKYIWDSINLTMYLDVDSSGLKRIPPSLTMLEKFIPDLEIISVQREEPKELKSMEPIRDEEDSTLDALHDAMTNIEFSCYLCKHFHKDGTSCDAFPDQIPDSIINGPKKHIERMFDQDNDIFFEKEAS
jgi:hypothetical protein